MTSNSIRENLKEIRQTEADAKNIVEEAEKKKEATIENAKKKAQTHMEKAEIEVKKYEDFVLERSMAEAEAVSEELRQKADQEVAKLTRIAKENRGKTVDLIMKHLASPQATNDEQNEMSGPPED